MCLKLRNDYKVPYNKSGFRWKVVVLSANGEYYAPFMDSRYTRKKYNIARRFSKKIKRFGFHVFVNRRAAVNCKNGFWSMKDYAVKKVAVKGFLASGTYGGCYSETWKRIKFLD